MDYSNVKNKTIFDFCKDIRILRFITNQKNPNRSEYVTMNDQDNCICDLQMLAFLTDDDNLYSALFDVSTRIIEWDKDVFDFKETLQ